MSAVYQRYWWETANAAKTLVWSTLKQVEWEPCGVTYLCFTVVTVSAATLFATFFAAASNPVHIVANPDKSRALFNCDRKDIYNIANISSSNKYGSFELTLHLTILNCINISQYWCFTEPKHFNDSLTIFKWLIAHITGFWHHLVFVINVINNMKAFLLHGKILYV